MSDSHESQSKDEARMEAGTQLEQAIETDRAITVEVSSAERAKVWAQIFENRFVGKYLGKNRFVFASDELEILRRAGVQYQVLSSISSS